MRQEVQVTMTIDCLAVHNKERIAAIVKRAVERFVDMNVTRIDVKEEAEIYGNE